MEKTKLAPAIIIQHVVSALLAVATAILTILIATGVIQPDMQETVRTAVSTGIVAVGAVATTLSELIPFLIKIVKDKNYAEILSIVRQCVVEVENIQGLPGSEKKGKVLEAVKKLLAERNIQFDIKAIDDMIESVVAIMNSIKKSN